MEPTVECLPIHLEGKQNIVYDTLRPEEALNLASSKLLLYLQRPNLPELEQVPYQQFYETYIIHSSRPVNEECSDMGASG